MNTVVNLMYWLPIAYVALSILAHVAGDGLSKYFHLEDEPNN